MEALQQQDALVARTVEAMKDDYWVLDTILSLAVTFLLPLQLVLPLPGDLCHYAPSTHALGNSSLWASQILSSMQAAMMTRGMLSLVNLSWVVRVHKHPFR